MGIEFQILDALQKIHTPILDTVHGSNYKFGKCRHYLDYTGSGVIDLSED